MLIIACVAVPEICPVEESNVNPAGRAGDMLKVKVPSPPEAVTGVKGVKAVLVVSVFDATANVVVNSAPLNSTAKLNVADPVCPDAPVQVTV